jgi:hypothetical protein
MFLFKLHIAAAVLLAAVVVAGADDKEKSAPKATTPDGKITATADGKAISLLDPATGKILAKMVGHTDTVTALTF